MQKFFPKCHCLKKSRNDRLYDKGKKHLTKELDVVEFLKLSRECKAFIKVFVGREDRLNYIKPARMRYVSSDDSSGNGDGGDVDDLNASAINRTNDQFKSSIIVLDENNELNRIKPVELP